jgi:DNA repair protein RadC
MTNKVNNEPAAEYKADNTKTVSYAALSDSELLAKISGKSKTYCLNQLKQYKTLHDIEKNTDLISAAIELSKRYIFEDMQRGDAITSPKQTRDYLTLELSNDESESFCVLFLDNRNRVIKFERMFNGTIDGASVYPREVLKAALHNNAAAVIFAHNHPSGIAEPSQADIKITNRLKAALDMVDIRTLDHFIIGDEVISFVERGLI